MKKFSNTAVRLCGVMEGETQPAGGATVEIPAMDILAKFGFTPEMLKGENITADGLVATKLAEIENNTALRIKSDTEKTAKAEITQTVWSAAEKRLMAEFGIDETILKDVEPQKRTETILKAAKAAHATEIDKVKNGDAKLFLEQNKELHALLEKTKTEHETALATEQQKLQNYITNFEFENEVAAAISKLENLAPNETPQKIKTLFDAELRAKGGFKVAEVNGAKQYLVTDKDGNVLRSKARPTENMTIAELLTETTEKYGCIAKSNGGNGGQQQPIFINDGKKLADGVRPIE